MINSLRVRISLGTTVSTALVVSIAAICVWFAGRTIFERTIDARLLERMHGWQQRGVGVPAHGPHWRETPAPDVTPSSFLVQVLDSDHRELVRSPGLAVNISLTSLLCLAPHPGQIIAMRLSDGRPVLGLWTPAMSRPGPPPGMVPDGPPPQFKIQPVIAFVAYDMTAFDGELKRLGWLLFALWVAAVMLSALISVWLCQAVLRPVSRLSQTIKDIDPSNFSARVAPERVPLELMEVLHRLNELFDSVEKAIQREKSTIANIAHELRNPIAGLRTTLEFAMARPCDAGAKQVQDRCLGMVLQMQSLVTNLLTLARLEAGQERWIPEMVDVVPLLLSTWEPLSTSAQQRQIATEWTMPASAIITSSKDQLRVVLSNLLDNAVTYTPTGGDIAVSAAVIGTHLELSVSNATDGSLAEASKVFQPFWRGDKVRSVGSHYGLGLSLVERIVHCLHGTITARITAQQRFHIQVSLPLE